MSRLLDEFQQYLTKMQQYEHVTTLLFWDMKTKAPKLGQAAHIEAEKIYGDIWIDRLTV